MVKGGAYTALARRQIAAGNGQKVQVARNFTGNLGAGKGMHPTGGHFERQRHSAHQPADLYNMTAILGGKNKVAIRALGAFNKERYGGIVLQVGDGLCIRTRWGWGRRDQRRQIKNPLACQRQPFARGGQHFHGRGGL